MEKGRITADATHQCESHLRVLLLHCLPFVLFSYIHKRGEHKEERTGQAHKQKKTQHCLDIFYEPMTGMPNSNLSYGKYTATLLLPLPKQKLTKDVRQSPSHERPTQFLQIPINMEKASFQNLAYIT